MRATRRFGILNQFRVATGVEKVVKRIPVLSDAVARDFSSEKRKNDPPSAELDGIPLLYHAGLGLASYGTIYLSMLGFSYIGLEMNFLTCDMVAISADACVDQVCQASPPFSPR
jgi:hypothetical protein